jgi:2',3'-cyclic-nucleotide 2'-phosphodiesterase (5'-nucleotidase family)
MNTFMAMKKYLLACLSAGLFIVSCSTSKNTVGGDDGRLTLQLVQINDVYEIAPLNGGKEGGMARVASLKKTYLRQNPNTLLVMAGDFLSPSVYNSLKYEGKSIRGRQMIESMNAAGVDLAVFGNHEFDIREAELQERINESKFDWISSNTFHNIKGRSLPFTRSEKNVDVPFPVSLVKTFTDADGTTVKIGFIGLTLPFNKSAYVSYTDVFTTARDLYNSLKDSVDAVVAITHQSMEEDERLAREVPGLAAILGGHEHDQRYAQVGKTIITKAMANAKSAYIINLTLVKWNHRIKVRTQLEPINEMVAIDSSTNVVVQRWVNIAEKSYSSLGFDAKKIVLREGEPLDGRESEIRSRPTNLTKKIVEAMAKAAPLAEIAILNAGSVRVDDVLNMPVTQYDIIRSLPFGGSIREVDMKGSLLIKVLDQGVQNKGIGGYLHSDSRLQYDGDVKKWKLRNQVIDPEKSYRVAL